MNTAQHSIQDRFPHVVPHWPGSKPHPEALAVISEGRDVVSSAVGNTITRHTDRGKRSDRPPLYYPVGPALDDIIGGIKKQSGE
ncbi:hypothetical protein NDU88_007772 [Pleurodeles waltl]|uniref:Uncharacterized protein n=1 Tax=Pleurodeles waltl TaxID=8319 RepID=A0AAV7RTS6_PLEWA|nr:hypothetical protein NDU88_007772 [Pleurodeles waltl]